MHTKKNRASPLTDKKKSNSVRRREKNIEQTENLPTPHQKSNGPSLNSSLSFTTKQNKQTHHSFIPFTYVRAYVQPMTSLPAKMTSWPQILTSSPISCVRTQYDAYVRKMTSVPYFPARSRHFRSHMGGGGNTTNSAFRPRS
jgi:hypothetical protein